MKEEEMHAKRNLLRDKYNKEDILSQTFFQEYKFEEFEDIKIIKTHFFFCLYEATHKGKNVLLLKMRYFNKTLLKNSMNASNVFKVKSKYLLYRKGYIYNHFTSEFYIVYERPIGNIFDFDIFLQTEDSTLLKIYIFNKIAQLLDRLKRNLKDNFKIGLIQPDLFVLNINDEIPIKMIDFFFYFFLHLANSDKSLDFLRPALGMYELDRILPDDIANMKIILTKLFTLEEHEVDLNNLKNQFYMELNTKVNMYKINALKEFAMEKNNQDSFLFEKQVLKIKNEKIREFILNFDQFKLSDCYGADVKYDYHDFYAKGVEPLYKNIIHDYECFTIGCSEKAEDIIPYCFEALCKRCKKNHKCKVLKYNELNAIYEKIPNLSDRINSIKELQTSIPRTEVVDFTEHFYDKHYLTFNSIKYTFSIFKKTIISKQEYFDFILVHLQQKFKENFDNKIAEVEEILQNLNPEDELLITDLNNKLKDIEDFVLDAQSKFEKIFSDLSINESLYEILTSASEYNLKLDSFYKNFIEYCLNDSYQTTIEELNKLNYSDEPMMNEITVREKQLDFYIPIFETDLMTKIYDIKKVNNTIKSKSEDIHLEFSDEIDLKLIPYDSRYCRINKSIIVTGGCIDSKTSSELNYTYIIDIKTYKVKKSADMKFPRKSHSIINHNDLYAIVVGGNDNDKCERFSYLIEQWEEIPPLIKKRANPSLFIYNNNYLYCFGGDHEGKPYQYYFIERIELYSEKYKWKEINFMIYDEDVMISGINYGIVRKNENTIFILGGLEFDERDNDYSESDIVYEYNISKNIIRTLDLTVEKGWYIENNFIDLEIKGYKFQVAFDKERLPILVKFKI